MPHHLVGTAEIAAMLGVSRQRVDQLAGSYADFPRPEAELAAGRIWAREAIEGWLATHPERKPGREEGRGFMFERLTDRARRAFVLAQAEAAELGHNHLGCEHLVLGLLREGEGLAAKTMSGLGLTLEKARASLEGFLGRGIAQPEIRPPFTPRVKRALWEAQMWSTQIGHSYVGTEHVLMGILREGENVGCRLLIESGVDLAAVRHKVLELMGFPQPSQPPSAASAALDELVAQVAALGARLERIEERLP